MPINNVASSTYRAVSPTPPSSPVKDFSRKTIHGRDLILINPFCDGGGDHALANKIANIALEEGCRVTIVPISAKAHEGKILGHRNIPLSGVDHHISDLRDPIFIVAPVGIFETEALAKAVSQLCDQYKFPREDIALIEEMDLLTLPEQELSHRVSMLQQMGFNTVNAFKLGFGEGAIGYLPVDQGSANNIKNRFEGELVKLLDSYNLSLAKDSHYHLAYISSKTMISASQVFVANSLSDTRSDKKDANFVMVVRLLNEDVKERLLNGLREILTTRTDKKYNFPALYSKVSIAFSNPDTGKLLPAIEIKGEGQRRVNILFASNLPQNIFHDFMCLAHSGMASGDQSLSEFLSLTGKLPYYDMQPWKEPLTIAIRETAAALGGAELKQQIANRIVGREAFTGRIITQYAPNCGQTEQPGLNNALAELDKQISTRTADHHIRSLLAARQTE
ncbi:hypothetical protein [Burkholderia dolosa]|uniref:hypothetical protein n=1 Tax=Burkholderia dolosa TaxID=152500 RepID=UPI0015913F21|nr:hypothetical protein [Burkholderia dolosa]